MRPRSPGAFLLPALAGPIELSTRDIVVLLLVVLALVFTLPVLVGSIAVMIYRRRTPATARDRRDAVLEFLKWALIAFVAQFALVQLVQLLS